MAVRSPVSSARAARQLDERGAGRDLLAVLVVPEDLDLGIEFLEGAVEPLGAAEDPILAGHEARRGGTGFGDEAGGQVPGADVLAQGAGDVVGNGFFQQVECVWHPRDSTRVPRPAFRGPIPLETTGKCRI